MPNHLSKEDYLFLLKIDILNKGKLAKVLSENGNACWTVCPECLIDDFCHVEDCKIYRKTRKK